MIMTLVLFPHFAWAGLTAADPSAAVQAPATPAPKTQVLFFGGCGANSGSMASWEKGFRKTKYGSRYEFTGVPYPGGGCGDGDVLSSGKGLIQKYAALINAKIKANPQQEIILVAHSSAGQLPGAIAEFLPKSAHVKVVILDGFNSSTGVQNKFPTTCYSARSSMSSCRDRIAFSAGCTQSFCKHFRMVNVNAGPNTEIPTGYDNFSPYTGWLDRINATATAHTDSGASH
jgi:hypothetical protein